MGRQILGMDFVPNWGIWRLNYESHHFQTCINGFATKIPTKKWYFYVGFGQSYGIYEDFPQEDHFEIFPSNCEGERENGRGGWVK